MEQPELNTLLHGLIDEWESEIVEFKQADNDYKTTKIGEYFSALSNEANLRDQARAWLVFGVNNKTRAVVGSHYRNNDEQLQSMKYQISQGTEPSITFRNIYAIQVNGCRVVLFEIPAAPKGMPVSWNGHYYARSGESLGPLGMDKNDEIRQQTLAQDWTAQIVTNATLEDLDSVAVKKAQEAFSQKYANRFDIGEVESWNLSTFLDRARITQNGKITRAALLLLGKAESAWRLSPHPAQMTWKLEGEERAYEHFTPPFLLASSQLYQRIRNIQLRILPENNLLPVEVSKYDQKIILEALHNCIAHQDYTRNGRILVTEKKDLLEFESEGSFFEGQPSDYIEGNQTPKRYRNPFLVQAMVELNMIDTMGYGIYDMHKRQARRYLPMPDYDLSEQNAVKLTIHGGVVDHAYSRLLIQKTDLPLNDILALDRIQKKLSVPKKVVTHLRKAGLVEGRQPNIYVSAKVASTMSAKAGYIKTRAQDDEFYIKLITDYLHKFHRATRPEIDNLLMDKLSDALDNTQKSKKVDNLLTKLRRTEVIINQGSRTKSEWVLVGSVASK